MKAIESFVGEYRFLSNFWWVEVKLDGMIYPSVEHAYQAAKTHSGLEREVVALCKTPGAAKRMGRRVTKRPDWEEIKDDVMYDLVRQKFAHKSLKAMLLETGDAKLVEGNNWNDTYWGVCRGQGHNKLGIILMSVRSN